MASTLEVTVQKDLVYAEDGRPLLWDIYSPAGPATQRPVALLLHGGGWRMGSRDLMAGAATELAQRGFVAIAPEYRLIGEVAWPTPLNDVRTSVRAVRAHAKALAINPDQVFAVGFSAGGHLALMAAGAPAASFPAQNRPHGNMSEMINGVAAFFPVAKLNPQFAQMLGVGVDQIEAVSPTTYADKLPPTIIFCGDADPIAPLPLSTELHSAITSAGGVADLRVYSRVVHEFLSLPGMMAVTVGDTVEFFHRTVINKEPFDQALAQLKKWWEEILAQAAQPHD